MKKLRRLTLACLSSATLLLPIQSAFGLGLGRIQLESYLNQPLQAQVAINALGDVNPSEIRVRLANTDAFEKAGIERPFYLTELEFSVIEKDGQPYVKITSYDPVTDPFLSFVVEANWSSGRVLREYTLLLDPIESPAQPKKVIAKPTKPISKVRLGYQSVKKPGPSSQGVTYGPVRADEALWDIAAMHAKQTGGDVNQSMIAIAQKNPNAFIRGNLNGLRKGAVLKMPSKEEVFQISVSEAIVQVIEHQQAWTEKRALKKSIPQEPQVVENKPQIHKPLKLVMPTQELSKPEMPQHKEASKPADKPEPQQVPTLADNDAFKNRLLMIEETLDTLKRSNQALKDTQKSLEDSNKALRELLAKKDEQIKLLTSASRAPKTSSQQADPLAQDTVVPANKTMEPVKTQGKKVEPLKLDLPKTQSIPSEKTEFSGSASTPSPVAQSSPVAAPAPVVTQPSPGIPSNSVIQSEGGGGMPWWMLGVLLLGFGGLGAGYEFYRRKYGFASFFTKKQEADEPTTVRTQVVSNPKESTSQEIQDAFSVFDEVQTTTSHPSVKEPLQAFEKESSEQELDALEENILSDADVYIAYERYDQAEMVLNAHLEKHPNDWPAHLKLLEVYHLSNRVSELTKHINRLPADLAARDPRTWHDIQALIETAISTQQAKVTAPSSFSEQIPAKTEALEEVEVALPEKTQGSIQETTHEFDEQSQDGFESQSGGIPNLADKCGVADKEVKFDMSLDDEASFEQSSETSQTTLEPADKPQEANTDENDAFSYLEEADDVETKLALAQAYIDLEDKALAKDHIEQVLALGNEAQKDKARLLLEQLNDL